MSKLGGKMHIIATAVLGFLSALSLALVGFLHSRSVSQGEKQCAQDVRIEKLEEAILRFETKLDRFIERET